MNIKDLLHEAVTPVLFHATSISSAMRIIKEKSINGSKSKRGYYISFARNRTGEYPLHMGEDMTGTTEPYAVIEFDGRSIASKNSISPINPFYDPYDDDIGTINYQEDRMDLGSSPSLKLPQGSIRKIHIVLNGMSETNVEKVSKIPNHPVFAWYATTRDFMQRKTLGGKPELEVEWDAVEYVISTDLASHDRRRIDRAKSIILSYPKGDVEKVRKIALAVYNEFGITGRTLKEILDQI